MARYSRRLLLTVMLSLFGIIALNQTYLQRGGDTLEDNALTLRGRRFSKSLLLNGSAIENRRYTKENVKLHAATLFFHMPVTNERFLGHCSVKKHCEIITNREKADAVLYHGSDFVSVGALQPNQIAVLWNLESPMNQPLRGNYENRINWTMTYRRDADVPLPYGVFRKREEKAVVDYEGIWAKKRMDGAVWLVSNCGHRNGRIKLANAIRSAGVSVDIYGGCGSLKTPNNCEGVNKQSDDCVAELFMPYKFALSFENSLCRDYITEKFYEVLQKRYAVPIVMQRKPYEDIGAPNDSFIAVDDFSNLRDLSEYVHLLAKNKAKYLRFHRWRETYTVESAYFSIEDTGFCELCKKIMRQDFSPKHYSSPSEWHSSGTCTVPQDGFVEEFLRR